MRSTTIDEINATPMERLRFRDFLAMKSGRDQFSRLGIEQLREHVSASAWETAYAEFCEHDKSLAICLRWLARGLTLDKAIRKVRTDEEVSANAVSAANDRRRSLERMAPALRDKFASYL